MEQMVQITKVLTERDREAKIVPIILDCIRDSESEERRLQAVILIDELCEVLGQEICRDQLLYEVITLQDDPALKVRREVITRLVRLSKVLGDQMVVGVILPVFRKLSQDPIWSVRKACVEVLADISQICSPETKNSQLIMLFEKFSQDASKWVKMATFQHFGPFIYSLDGLEPNPKMVDYFLSMGGKDGKKVQKISQIDNDTAFHCAYNFPAVLKVLGPKYWADHLQPMYAQLVTDNRWKVRRSLAFSIHECAVILGPEITEKNLLPILFHFLQDLTEVAEGALQNLPQIL